MNTVAHFDALACLRENMNILMNFGKPKPGITISFFPVFYILHPHKGICTQ
jgi:hypothetical protein